MTNIYLDGMQKLASDNSLRDAALGTAGAVGTGVAAMGAIDAYRLHSIPKPTAAEKALAGLQGAHDTVSSAVNKGLKAMKAVENVTDTAGMFYGGYARADIGAALHHLAHNDHIAAVGALNLRPEHQHAVMHRLAQIRSNPADPLHGSVQTADGLKKLVQDTLASSRDVMTRAGRIVQRGILRP